MYMKGLALAAALTLGQFAPAKADEVLKFHPYVSLGSVCLDKLTDKRLAGAPVPLGAHLDCAVTIDNTSPAPTRATRLVFDARSRRIVGTRPD